MLFATIDTGTTNTRVIVWKDEAVLAEAGRPVGVRDTAITGSTETLKGGVRDAIAEALAAAGVTDTGQVLFLASGMITANVGLCEIPHLPAPAGKAELAAAMRSARLPDVVDQPIWFIPGIKSHDGPITLESCAAMDIMRGEETEAVGILHALDLRGPAILVLPGSHTKFVRIDEQGRIAGSVTTISGELLDVLTKNTLIASSLNHSFADHVVPEALLRGAEYGRTLSLGRSAFLIRLLDLFGDADLAARTNFLLGAVLSSDIMALKNSPSLALQPDMRIIIGGKQILRDAFDLLLHADSGFTGGIEAVPDGLKSAAALGAREIARTRGLFQQ
ncbi:2-dehydro-3-deoxygalactonokinase [Azospirillum picis]|uniref:2-dehydro-3-deoxygalactonokinase n=1 Tax=Azospirillum picis TaxID=488438 RepID=A0ABU0MK70_9PROT|nr:2-dehydro-3-deoxygalactonokinase [Azospirillum picis]MBP2299858.1 2-dehydro-3-deoxygalactonokinase [Azospirillum picis]MDQ0533654.1 2-dehydro-3-deoxygalactonokinase [Azospirillum picis]